MASNKLAGRPRIAWTASRQRKLVRLYLMTDIKINEIQMLLKEDGFKPSTRTIQAQLGVLLPDNAKAWRQYRPSSIGQAKTRLSHLKRCRDYYKQKSFRLEPQTGSISHPRKLCQNSDLSQVTTAFYDPTRHYKKFTPHEGVSHCFLPQLSNWYSQQNFSHQIGQALEESRIDDRGSDKEVVAFDSDSIAILSKAVTQAIVPERLSIECPGTQTLQDSALSISAAEQRAGSMFRGTKRPFGNVSNASTAPRRDLSWRGVSRLASTSWSHVSSVLSATNSWRSSLALRLSFSTGRSSSTNQNSWTSQFIDQSKFVSTPWTLPHLESVSLYNRPCCFFMDPCAHPEKSCEVCDYSESHHLARTCGAGDLDLIDASIQDLFGNLPLHHAAAVGNIQCVRHLLSNARRDMTHGLNHRNSSGETFLHVYRIREPDDFPDYLVIARQAIEQGLRLSIRDYQGKSMKERMIEMLNHCKIGQIQLREALELFDSLYTSQGTISDVLILVEGSNVPVTWLMPSIDEDLEEDEKEGFHLGLVKINPTELDQKQLQTKIKAHSPDTRSSLERLRPPRIAKLSILERDSNGDTHLISVLKRWPKASLVSSHLKKLIQNSDIHMRDCHGYTALAIAARRGLRDAVSLLLERGANPNTRSVQKKSLLDHVLGYLNLTQKESSEENDILYARILSCMVLLIDNGATVNVTELDDYTMLPVCNSEL